MGGGRILAQPGKIVGNNNGFDEDMAMLFPEPEASSSGRSTPVEENVARTEEGIAELFEAADKEAERTHEAERIFREAKSALKAAKFSCKQHGAASRECRLATKNASSLVNQAAKVAEFRMSAREVVQNIQEQVEEFEREYVGMTRQEARKKVKEENPTASSEEIEQKAARLMLSTGRMKEDLARQKRKAKELASKVSVNEEERKKLEDDYNKMIEELKTLRRNGNAKKHGKEKAEEKPLVIQITETE